MTDTFHDRVPYVRASLGADGTVNVRLSRAHLKAEGLFNGKSSICLAASYDKTTKLLTLTPAEDGATPQNYKGKKLQDTDEELSYYYRNDCLGFSHFSFFGYMRIQPVPFRFNGSGLQLLLPGKAARKAAAAVSELPLRKGLASKPPVLLSEASLAQVAERLMELASE